MKKVIKSRTEMAGIIGVATEDIRATMSGLWQVHLCDVKDAAATRRPVWLYFSPETDLDENGKPVSSLRFALPQPEIFAGAQAFSGPMGYISQHFWWCQQFKDADDEGIHLKICKPLDAIVLLGITTASTRIEQDVIKFAEQNSLVLQSWEPMDEGLSWLLADEKATEKVPTKPIANLFKATDVATDSAEQKGSTVGAMTETRQLVLMSVGFQNLTHNVVDRPWIEQQADERKVKIDTEEDFNNFVKVLWNERWSEVANEQRNTAQRQLRDWREQCETFHKKQKLIRELLPKVYDVKHQLEALPEDAARMVKATDIRAEVDPMRDRMWWASLELGDSKDEYNWLGKRYELTEQNVASLRKDLEKAKALVERASLCIQAHGAILTQARKCFATVVIYDRDGLQDKELVPPNWLLDSEIIVELRPERIDVINGPYVATITSSTRGDKIRVNGRCRNKFRYEDYRMAIQCVDELYQTGRSLTLDIYEGCRKKIKMIKK